MQVSTPDMEVVPSCEVFQSVQTSGVQSTAVEFILEKIQIDLGAGSVRLQDIEIPADISESQKQAFRDLYKKVYESVEKAESSSRKDLTQDKKLDTHERRLDKDPQNAP